MNLQHSIKPKVLKVREEIPIYVAWVKEWKTMGLLLLVSIKQVRFYRELAPYPWHERDSHHVRGLR